MHTNLFDHIDIKVRLSTRFPLAAQLTRLTRMNFLWPCSLRTSTSSMAMLLTSTQSARHMRTRLLHMAASTSSSVALGLMATLHLTSLGPR